MKECRSSDLAGNQDLPFKNDWSKLQVIGPLKALSALEGKWRGVNMASCLSSVYTLGLYSPSVGGITPDRW